MVRGPSSTRRKTSLPSTPRHESEDAEDEEPRLPSTPVHLGLEPSSKPPCGLLSSGSARRFGHKNHSVQSSPLKPQRTQRLDGRTQIVSLTTSDSLLTIRLRLRYEKLGNELLDMKLLEITDWAKAELGSRIRDLAARNHLFHMRQMLNDY